MLLSILVMLHVLVFGDWLSLIVVRDRLLYILLTKNITKSIIKLLTNRHPIYTILSFIQYIISDTKIMQNIRRLCTINLKSNSLLSCLSISTMCLLIFTSIIIITIISITPIIILGLGEISAGQRDVILTPTQGGYLNATRIGELSGEVAMPRISAPVLVGGVSGVGWFMDFGLEEQQHLGTLVLNKNISESDEPVYLHTQYGIREGQTVTIQLLDIDMLATLAKQFQQSNPELVKNLQYLIGMGQPLEAEFKVAGIFELAMGKFPIGTTGGYAYFQIRTALQHFIRQTLRKNNIVIDNQNYQQINLAWYSNTVTINIPNRIQVYSNSDYQKTYQTLSNFGIRILEKIGMFAVFSQIPIASSLTEMSYFGMFIGVILKLVIVSLFVLSVLMMNNMMLMGTERKGFDFALLKTMGAGRGYVVANLIVASMRYVLVANFVAFPFAYLVLKMVSGMFQMFFGYSYDVEPTFGAIVGGLLIGVLVPIVSSVAPIWGIINNDLVENLNPVRNKTEAIHTEVYIEGRQFPAGKLAFGLISSIFGLMIYYLLPKGLINQDVGMLLIVFFSIIMGLLLGLILLAYSGQYLFEKFVAYLTLFWVNKTDFILTLKNMSAHRFKNRRASLLYSLSVAFIIFVSVGISIQLQTIKQYSLARHGTYMEILSHSGSIYRPFYEKIFKEDFKDDIQDWAYQTTDIWQQIAFNSKAMKIQFSDKARTFLMGVTLYGVSANFAQVQTSYRLPIVKSHAYTPYDPYQFLYSPQGFMTCAISQFAAKKFNLLDTDNRQFLLSVYKKDKVQRIKLNMSTVFTQTAGLKYSRFQYGWHEVAVSFDTFAELMGLRTYDELPIAKIKLKVKHPENTTDFANRLRVKMATRNSNYVWNYLQTRQTIQKIESLLKNILNILLVMVLLISFFSLVTTSYINIVNQSNQIAILLTLGYQKSRIVRIFIYESFVLVLNSCLIGVAVGTFVAWMMGLQRELFGDFPVKIEIDGIWIIAVAAIVSSLLSIVKPMFEIFGQSINQIFMYS